MGNQIVTTHDPQAGQVFSTAPQRIGAGMHKLLENAELYEAGTIAKRRGWEDLGLATATGGTIAASDVHTVGHLGDETLLWANDRLYSYDEMARVWVDRGPWTLLESRALTVHDTQPDQFAVGIGRLGDRRVVAWREGSLSSPSSQWRIGVHEIIDGDPDEIRYAATNIAPADGQIYEPSGGLTRQLVTEHTRSTDGAPFVMHAHGDDPSFVLLSPQFQFDLLPVAQFTITNRQGVVDAESGLTFPVFDSYAVQHNQYTYSRNTATGNIEVHRSQNGNAPALFQTFATGAILLISGATTVSGVSLIAYVESATPLVYRYVSIDGLNTVQFTHNVSLGGTAANIDNLSVQNLENLVSGPQPKIIAVDYTTSDGGELIATTEWWEVISGAITDALAAGPVYGAQMAARPVTRSLSSMWAPMYLVGPPTTFVVREIYSGEIVASAGQLGQADQPRALVPPPSCSIAGGDVEVPLTIRRASIGDRDFRAFGASTPLILILQDRQDAAFPVQFQNAAAWAAAGYLRLYDQSRIFEANYHALPVTTQFQLDTAASTPMDVGTYSYALTWGWQDVTGRVYQGPPVFRGPITTDAVFDHVLISVVGFAWTEKVGTYLEVWRTLAGQAGPYHLVSSRVTPLVVTGAGAQFTFDDQFTDADIQDNETLDLASLPNDSCPITDWCAVAGDRVWSRSQLEPTVIFASKLPVEGVGTQMSPYIAVSASSEALPDPATGITSQDGQYYLFQTQTVSAFAGDGPDNTGAGGAFSFPAVLPADDGHVLSGGAVTTPIGVVWVSDDGIGSIGRDQSLRQASEAIVAAYRDMNFSARQVHYDRGRKELWILDDGRGGPLNPYPGMPGPRTLVLSPSTGRWTTLPPALLARSMSSGADTGKVLVTAGVAGGRVLRELEDGYAIAGIRAPLRMRTGWLSAGKMGGVPLSRGEAVITMNYRSPHTLVVVVRVNFDECPVVRMRVDPDEPVVRSGAVVTAGAVSGAVVWAGPGTWAIDDQEVWGGCISGVPNLSQYQVYLSELPSPVWALDVEIMDDSGDGAGWEFVSLDLSADPSRSQSALVPLPAIRRFGRSG